MPQILDREEGLTRRRDRLAKLKKGPGTFVYTGESFDTNWSPTPKLTGTRAPALTAEGLPVVDAAGRQIYKPAGQIITDERGIPVLGGVPKVERVAIETRVVRGVEFPAGKPVAVEAGLALKLRCMAHFEEVEPAKAEEPEAVEKALGDLTKAELLALAETEGVEVPAGSNKAEIVALLEAKQAE